MASTAATPSNIVLTGFMGTGKTTVGRELAERIGWRFVDTDAVIEQRHGPISDIFRDYGEPTFRRYEQAVAAEVAHEANQVIATGGRLLLDPVNAEALGAAGRVFCLTAAVDTILARVTAADVANDRPLLAGSDVHERIVALLDERAPAYGRFEQVATDDRTPDAVADEILHRLGMSA